MSAPRLATDDHANRHPVVPTDELDEWAWLLGRLEDWLSQAQPGTLADWKDFAGPCGTGLDDVIYVLGHWAVRMRTLGKATSVATGAPTPSRDDGATMTCPVCGDGFVVSGRRRYCGDACRGAAWRRRHQSTPAPVVVPPGRARREVTVYECPNCDARSLADQRCDDCGTFARRAGTGGCCPHCDELVTVSELVGDDVVADGGGRR